MDKETTYPVRYRETLSNKVLFYTGIILLACIGLVMLFTIVTVFIQGEYKGGNPDYQGKGDLGGLIFGFVCCSGVPFAGSAFLWITLKKRKRQMETARSEWIHYHIINYTKMNKGRVSVPDIILNLQISSEEAKNAADELVVKGVLEVMITPSGAVVYGLSGYDQEQAITL